MKKPQLKYTVLSDEPEACKSLVVVDLQRQTGSVSIILDMSDSNHKVRIVSRQIAKLLRKLPIETPLFVYRLSSDRCLNLDEKTTLAHLCDDSISLLNFLDDRAEAGKASRSGTILRPVLEAIEKAAQANSVAEIISIVVTDGDLLDRAPINIPPRMKIAGVGSEISRDARKNWRRVLGDTPLLDISDPGFLAPTLNFDEEGGSSSLVVQVGAVGIERVSCFDESKGSMLPVQLPIDLNPSTKRMALLLESKADLPRDTVVSLTNIKSSAQWDIRLSDAAPIDDDEIEKFKTACATESTIGTRGCLIDVEVNGPGADGLEEVVQTIEQMARERIAWSGDERIFSSMMSFFDGSLSGLRNCDAGLCFVNRGEEGKILCRMLIIGLWVSNSPALDWRAGIASACGIPEHPMKVVYDRMEGRWQASFGDCEFIQLDPSGSQLVVSNLKFDTGLWSCYYSGPLA